MQSQNLNTTRSEETQQKLIQATLSALVDVGFSRTTGVEICRRAGVTRGALNHHFPVFSDLLVCVLEDVYTTMSEGIFDISDLTLTQFVEMSYQRVIQPQYKAVIELWLAAQNEPDIGDSLRRAIEKGFAMIVPENVFSGPGTDPRTEALFLTLFELLIAIGLGRATSGGKKPIHESAVYETMLTLAKENDKKRGKI